MEKLDSPSADVVIHAINITIYRHIYLWQLYSNQTKMIINC